MGPLTMRRVAGVVAAALCTTCGGSPAAPASNALATIAVSNETFSVLLTTADQIAAARAAQAGGRARIPNGRIVSGTQVNTGWSWHLDDVSFAEVTTEVCDGRPSDVERQGTSFGGGRFCPWSATVIRVDNR
jgi:hypothetical protein